MRLTAVTNLKITEFSGGVVTGYESGMTNAVAVKKNGRLVATQRPGIDVFEDASFYSAPARGRAIFYWDKNSALYFVNDNKIYKNSYSNSIATIGGGFAKATFTPIGNTLVLVDHKNNQAWTITLGDLVTEITDVDFPSRQTPVVPLAFGVAVLDRTLYVLGTNGVIYGSDLNNPTAWAALNYIEAERDPDGGTFIGKHHDHIIAYGPRSIEFFYNAANPTGSPLNRRSDVAYGIGCHSGESVWHEGDRSFFIGVNNSGALGIYSIEQFSVRKISQDEMDAFITQALSRDGYSAVASGFTARGHTFYLLTFYTAPNGNIIPEGTLVYDDTAGIWGFWETSISGITHFPVTNWSVRNSVQPRFGEGIMANGDLVSVVESAYPVDTVAGASFVADGFVDAGFVVGSSDVGSSISVVLRLGQFDGGTNDVKFCGAIQYVGNAPSNSQTMTVKHSNENNQSWTAGNSVDISRHRRIARLGRFRRRNHQIEFASTGIIEVEGLEIELDKGTG